MNLNDSLPNVKLIVIMMFADHYKYIIHFLSMGYAPKGLSTAQIFLLVV